MTRPTTRIPRSQRKRRGREVTLGPEAEAILQDLPQRQVSSYVEYAVIQQAKRDRRSYDKAKRRSLNEAIQ